MIADKGWETNKAKHVDEELACKGVIVISCIYMWFHIDYCCN